MLRVVGILHHRARCRRRMDRRIAAADDDVVFIADNTIENLVNFRIELSNSKSTFLISGFIRLNHSKPIGFTEQIFGALGEVK